MYFIFKLHLLFFDMEEKKEFKRKYNFVMNKTFRSRPVIFINLDIKNLQNQTWREWMRKKYYIYTGVSLYSWVYVCVSLYMSVCLYHSLILSLSLSLSLSTCIYTQTHTHTHIYVYTFSASTCNFSMKC